MLSCLKRTSGQWQHYFLNFHFFCSLDIKIVLFLCEASGLDQGWQCELCCKHFGFGCRTVVSSIGHECHKSAPLLEQYMNYTVNKECPDDWHVAQQLMFRGCEPLPRRRCFARSPLAFPEPTPYPESLWANGHDGAISWTHYDCKSFDCLNDRINHDKYYDCIDCFNLQGLEKVRWITVQNRHDFTIDSVSFFFNIPSLLVQICEKVT